MEKPTPEQLLSSRVNEFNIAIQLLLNEKHTLPAMTLLLAAIDELLPFDLKQRRFPLTYRYCCWSAKPDNGAFRALITSAVSDALSGQHEAIERAKSGLSVECVQYIDKLGQSSNFNVNGLQAKQEIDRMLDLGLIRFDVDPKQEGFLYSYHWTYLGRALCDWYHEKRKRNSNEN